MARVVPGLRFAPRRGSYLPVLMKAVELTTGPILELGCGLYSTNPLHWACFVAKRRIVTYENNPAYHKFLKAYQCDFHEVHCIERWADIDISEPWSVAFVDHSPGPEEPEDSRWQEAIRLQHAEYVVMHDTETRNESSHRLSKIARRFKYQFAWRDTIPNTTVYSNVHDVSNFLANGK